VAFYFAKTTCVDTRCRCRIKHFLYKDYEDWILSGTDIILDQFKSKREYEKFLKSWSVADLMKIKEMVSM